MSIIKNKHWYNLTPDQKEMYLGAVVTSKKTGLPAIGIIMAIMEPEWYSRAFEVHLDSFERWDDLYEEWRAKPIVSILFKKPQKFISFTEFETVYREDKSPEWIRVHYDDLELAASALYPIDDLELYDCPENEDEEENDD